MVPITISEEKLDHLSRTFGCSKGSLPFTYLGLPLSLTKPDVMYGQAYTRRRRARDVRRATNRSARTEDVHAGNRPNST